MSFTSVIKELQRLDSVSKQIDKIYLTPSTLEKKYQTSKINQILASSHENGSKKDKNQHPIKSVKHRYFEDIQKDQLEDIDVFGYSTFEYFMYFKKNEAHQNRKTRRQKQKQARNNNQGKNEPNNRLSHNSDQQKNLRQSINRPMTAIVTRGTPTRRRVHHKLSLKQIQKAAISQNPLPSHIKQQYFTEQFFDFNNNNQKQIKVENIRCGSRSPTFYKQFSTVPSTFKQTKFKKYQGFSNHNSSTSEKENLPKRHLMFEATTTQFYANACPDKNLAKKKKCHLDDETVKKSRVIFRKDIDVHWENLRKKEEKRQNQNDNKVMESKSIVYEAIKKNNTKSGDNQIDKFTIEKNIRENLRRQPLDYVRSIPPNICQNTKESNQEDYLQQNIKTSEYAPNKTSESAHQQNTNNLKSLSITKNIFPSLKRHRELQYLHKSNCLILQRQQLSNLQLKYEHSSSFTLNHMAFNQVLTQNMNDLSSNEIDFMHKSLHHFHTKSNSKLPRQKVRKYDFWIIMCQDLQTYTIEAVEIKEGKFIVENQEVRILEIVSALLRQKPPGEFVHFMISMENTSYNSSNKSKQTKQSVNKETLIFETFIHASDIRYFQGREIQIQYFKYFFKRFILLDRSVSEDQLKSTLALIFQSEVKTPLQFEQFCQEMKLKDNLNVIIVRKFEQDSKTDDNEWKNEQSKESQLFFKSIEIRLSKLLLDANETIMMVKKELFEGYDWRGISLTKGTKQFRGYHLEHFYI